MDYVRYARAVIVLEEKDREFADRPGEEMKGYLRVETGNNRGAFRCVIQNVKYYPRSEYTYQLILFGKRGERTIHTVVGTIPVSRFAAGEVYLRFHPNDVDGQGNDYGSYTTVIVAAVSSKNRTEPLHPVLMGRTGHDAEENVPGSGPRLRAMTAETSAPPEIEPSQRSRRTYNHYYAEYLKHVCSYLWSVSGYYQEINPFGNRKARWLKIGDPSVMFLVSPGAKYFTDRYGHFLLGCSAAADDPGSCMYYVAVPGRFCKEDQPDGGESGFQLWLPLDSGKDPLKMETAYGYWILGIDGNSGEIFSCEDM